MDSNPTCAPSQYSLNAKQTTRIGFTFYEVTGRVFRSWALAVQGKEDEGISQMHQDCTIRQTLGAELRRPYTLALLAEVYSKKGEQEEGLNLLAKALATTRNTEEGFYEAELWRLKGELTLQSKVQSPQPKVPSTQHPTPNTQAEAEQCCIGS
jgi:predicted ATPase